VAMKWVLALGAAMSQQELPRLVYEWVPVC
jgi:hypothetical protein